MSNKTQLQTNNTTLASLTDRVLAAKDTAAALPDAGGGSVETCTVKLETGSGAYGVYYATTITNGNIDVSTGTIADEGLVNYIPDSVAAVEAICDSFMCVDVSDFRFASSVELSGGAELILHNTNLVYFKTPSEGGSVCVISAVQPES